MKTAEAWVCVVAKQGAAGEGSDFLEEDRGASAAAGEEGRTGAKPWQIYSSNCKSRNRWKLLKLRQILILANYNREEARAVKPPSKVALESRPRIAQQNDIGLIRAKRRPINRAPRARRCYPFKRFSRFTTDSMTAPNAGTSPNIIPDIAL